MEKITPNISITKTSNNSIDFRMDNNLSYAILSKCTDNNSWFLSTIVSNIPNKGYGTLILKEICKYADDNSINIINQVSPFKPMQWRNKYNVPILNVYLKLYNKFKFKVSECCRESNTALLIRNHKIA